MRSTPLTVLSALGLAFAVGCSPAADDSDPAAGSIASTALGTSSDTMALTASNPGLLEARGSVTSALAADAGRPASPGRPADAGAPATPPTPATPPAADAGTPAAPPPAADAGRPAAPPPSADAGRPAAPPPAADAGTPPAPTPTPTPTPAPAPTGPSLGGCQMFPADSPWNQDISGLPVRSDSPAIIANIQDHGETVLKADFGSNPQYGIPFTVVPDGQARVPVTFNEYGDESDAGPYPIPGAALVEAGNDHHVLVLEQGSCHLFELYHSARSGSGWTAGSGAIFDLRSNAPRTLRWTSADQAGLPILPGLARYDEVAAGEIRHALRVTFTHTQNGFIAPATHPGTLSDATAPVMGLRLRLRADYDLSRVTGHARVILTALRRYGLIVADTGGNWYVSGGTDSRWNDDDLQQLRDVPGTAFEAVNTGDIQR